MATTAEAHGNHPPTQHFPPSPPPSPSPPSSARRRHKKKPDPFEQLTATPLPSAPSSPAASSDSNTTEEEPLLTRILLTPLIFTSFLLSLFLINYRNRVRRTQSNAPNINNASSLLAYLIPSRWLDPEPYQDPLDTTWGHRNPSAPHAEPHDAISPRPGQQDKRGSWHLHKKIRKVARLEVGDALEMRGRVMMGMMAGLVLVGVAACLGLRWCFEVVAQALRA